MARERILLIDGSGYFFRAYYAIKSLNNSKGFPTNAIYGFVNMLLKTIETEKPKYLAIAFDTGKPTFRKERYAEYKANRSAAPDDLRVQIPIIFKAVDAFGIHRMEQPGYEADDVIGTVAKKAVEDGYDVEIITGDKDLMQLVNDRVSLYDSMKDKRINADAVREKFGVLPHQVVDLLALMGDSSDNIPGVSGIGEKTAAELIQKFGSLDNIYGALDQIPQAKRRETLKAEKEMAYLSQELATVKCDIDMPLEWSRFQYAGPRKAELSDIFQEMEFFQLIKRLGLEPTGEQAKADAALPTNYKTIRTEEELKALVASLKKAPMLAVDTETTGLSHDAKLVGISLSAEPGTGFYIPLHHVELGTQSLQPGQIANDVAQAHLRPLLEGDTPPKTGQNLKFDAQIFKAWGVELGGITHDSLLASYLVDASGAHNLDALAMRYLSHQNLTYEEVAGKGKAQINFSEVAIDKATAYSAEDADIALRLTQKLEPMLKERGAEKLYREVELPVAQVLAGMEYHGILVERKKLEQMGSDLENEMKATEEKIYRAAGKPFNIQSPKQLGEILFDELKLPVVKKTKTGRSTDESVLQTLSEQHEICQNILKFRGLAKLRSTYVEGLIAEIHPVTGRVHTHFNQTVTATGRLSSTEPNLQNIPVSDEAGGYDIRKVFVAPPGHTLLSADYSQVELRVLAHMSDDPGLREAFLKGEDIHETTGRFMFEVEKVTPEQRRVAKTINFGVVYGQTAYGLSSMLKIPPAEAKAFIEAYFAKYSNVRKFFQNVIDEARKNGYVSTMLGRRRYLPDLKADNRMVREMAERAAINAPVQGSAADLIKLAMIDIAKRLKEQSLKSKMLLQVHDELVFEVPNAELAAMRDLVRTGMEQAMKLTVPLKVEMGEGPSWGDC